MCATRHRTNSAVPRTTMSTMVVIMSLLVLCRSPNAVMLVASDGTNEAYVRAKNGEVLVAFLLGKHIKRWI